MEDQAAVVVPATKPESDAKVIRRIRKREEPGDRGPWKWQLISAILECSAKLDQVLKAVERTAQQSETSRKLSEAGKKSAEARRKKFGSAAPGGPTKVEIPAGAISAVPTNLLGEPVREPVRRKREKEKPQGSLVWDAYELAYQRRWNVTPIRNTKVNVQCKQLVDQVGAEQACALVGYYLQRTDAFYTNAKHPLGLLIVDLQKLRTEFLSGTAMTMRDAQRQETHSRTDQSIREYAATQGALE